MNSPSPTTSIGSPGTLGNDPPLRYTPSPTTPEARLHGRMERMELGLSEIRTALSTLKSTCAALEMQADMLGSEIAELKGLVTPRSSSLNQPATAIQVSGPLKVSPDDDDSGSSTRGLITPPPTPRLQRLTTAQVSPAEGRPSNGESHTLHSILGKRRFSDSEGSQSSGSDGGTEQSPKRTGHKRVRFADAELLQPPPIFHIQTPESYRSGTPTETLTEPIEMLAPPASIIPSRPSPPPESSPASAESSHLRELSRCTRRKTRWDPLTGKRIPIPASQALVEKVESDKDYERHLSESMSNTSLA
ncbi:hypothetical protein NLJ89_g2012 [Agrocybe chaxingu]|uniref:Uncharacterized protein n=1 Tax=Agrocybe chaxingu TaxID=84603 RepID=A0A9W8KBL4_9AGAR|nr:hypothetical protein NLJ89_g2012 [Agrocybe chaxingu]